MHFVAWLPELGRPAAGALPRGTTLAAGLELFPMSTVLVADDDQDIRETLQLVLEDAGYTVLLAQTGRQTLQVLRHSPERLVVLLDYLMPDLSGGEVLEAVAHLPALAQRHAFLLLTAMSATLPPTTKDRLQHLQVSLLKKPFDLDDLLAHVAAADATLVPVVH
jgi:CheY-like chemotaxis protein